MITSALSSKKKLIDLKEDTFKALSIMAIQHGTNLKNFIETILDKVADDYEDTLMYEYLSKTDIEGKQLLDEKEQKDFENRLGI